MDDVDKERQGTPLIMAATHRRVLFRVSSGFCPGGGLPGGLGERNGALWKGLGLSACSSRLLFSGGGRWANGFIRLGVNLIGLVLGLGPTFFCGSRVSMEKKVCLGWMSESPGRTGDVVTIWKNQLYLHARFKK
jgi:hypothetical protein